MNEIKEVVVTDLGNNKIVIGDLAIKLNLVEGIGIDTSLREVEVEGKKAKVFTLAFKLANFTFMIPYSTKEEVDQAFKKVVDLWSQMA